MIQPSQLLIISVLLFGAAASDTLLAQPTKPMSLEKTLSQSHWQKRVLLVLAPNAQHADFQQQKLLLASAEAGLAARDFLVLPVLYEQTSEADKQFLQRRTGIQPPAFAVVLIGKDGGIKEKSSRPMQPEALFGTVDRMPMRREEMKQRK